MSIYRFPAVSTDYDLKDQINKIKTELVEAKSAEIRYRCGGREMEAKDDLAMELLDIIHASETALRMFCTKDEVSEYHARVFRKNAYRGYYSTKAVYDEFLVEHPNFAVNMTAKNPALADGATL